MVDNAVQFCLQQLQLYQPRDDYQELLELTLIFLGVVPPRGIHFIKSGSMYRARFITWLIYSFKIFAFRAVFQLTRHKHREITALCIFGVKYYVKSWFLSRLPKAAPKSDLNLLKSLADSEDRVTKGAFKKLMNHQWYLSEKLAALAFFDSEVTLAEKKAMVVWRNKTPYRCSSSEHLIV